MKLRPGREDAAEAGNSDSVGLMTLCGSRDSRHRRKMMTPALWLSGALMGSLVTM